jgi:cardiolipin synthase A/B
LLRGQKEIPTPEPRGARHIDAARWYLPCSRFIAKNVSEKLEGDGAMLQKFPRARGWFASITLALLVIAVGCSRVTPHLELPHLETRQPAFAATLGGYSGTPVVPGNRVEILLNGREIFPAKLAMIRSARRTINYAQYVFESGQPAEEIAAALSERCRAGIQVNVLLDAVGALAMPGQLRTEMTEAGCRVETFRPLRPFTLDRYNYRNHRRILVVDGVVGVTGGSGISGKWSGNGKEAGHWRDTDVRIEGPVVEQLQGAFAENWLEATGVAIGGPAYFPRRRLDYKGDVDAQVVRSSPAGGSSAMYTVFLLALSSAQRSIHITNPYFVPDEKMMSTLLDAAQRGVKVKLLIPGAIDHNLVRQASRSAFGRLLKSGVLIYEYRPALLHAKTMVIDGIWATVGSTNLDHRSFALNEELNVVVYDSDVAGRLEEVFQRDLANSKQVTYEDWSDRGLTSRFLELLSWPLREQM